MLTLCSDPDPVMVLGTEVPPIVVKVTDDRDCCLEEQVLIDGAVNPAKYGDYPISYAIADEAGNEAVLDVEVTVTLAPESYFADEYDATDICESGTYNYLATIQDCTCPENKVQVINFGNFGPSAIYDFNLSGDYLEQISLDATIGSIDFQGSGLMGCSADTLYMSWTLDNGASTDQCETVMIRR